jgi:hypothetical protein
VTDSTKSDNIKTEVFKSTIIRDKSNETGMVLEMRIAMCPDRIVVSDSMETETMDTEVEMVSITGGIVIVDSVMMNILKDNTQVGYFARAAIADIHLMSI